MDLSKLKNIDEPVKCVLTHPVTDEVLTDDEGKEMFISVYGKDSGEYKRAFNARVNKSISSKKKTKTIEDGTNEAIELLAEITTDWNIVVDGKKPKYTKAEAVKLYSDWSWVKEQVDQFVHDRTVFFTS